MTRHRVFGPGDTPQATAVDAAVEATVGSGGADSAVVGGGAGNGERMLPAAGFAEVRIVAASPEVARKIAQVLRIRFAATEQRSSPAGCVDGGTRLDLTVDTVHFPDASGPFQLRLVGGSGTRRAEARDATDVPTRDSRPPEPPSPIQDDPSGDRPTR